MKVVHESIFLNTLRAFFVALFGAVGAMIGILLIVILFMAIFSSSDESHLPSKAVRLPDAEGNRAELGRHAPVILQISINGEIGKEDLTGSKIQETLLESREDSLKGGRVKGILLAINSPGGSAIDTNIIYQQIKAYKERYNVPVYAHIDGLCASGGYYLACACDKIYASETSLVGSIGVVTWPPYVNVQGALEKIGISTMTLSAGQDKDAMNPFRPWKENEHMNRQEIVDYFYQDFVATVTKNRSGVSQESLESIYGARIFPSDTAEEHGFIDGSGYDMSDTLNELAEAAGIGEDEKYQVITFKAKALWKQLLKNSPLMSGRVKYEISTLSESPALPYSYLYRP